MTAVYLPEPVRTATKKRTVCKLSSLARRRRVIVLVAHFAGGGHVTVAGLCRQIGEACWVGELCLPASTVVKRSSVGGPEWIAY